MLIWLYNAFVKWQEKDRKYVCVSLTGLVMPIIFVSFAWACIGHFQYDKIQCTEQMWYPICLSYNLVACWAFSEIQGHLPHFQDQYMKFWFLHFHHFHRMFGDNFLMPFKLDGMMNHHTCSCICCLTGLAIFSKH